MSAQAPAVNVDSPDHALLRVEDLTTWFWTPAGIVRAVDGVSFTLGRGRTLGIVGESGSGKSVLARSVMGLLPGGARAVRGAVWFGDRDLRRLSEGARRAIWGRDIAMVFQDPMTALNPVVRIERQITETLRLHLGLDREQARVRALTLLNEVGIPEPERRLRAHPHELSGGMRQRVCIAIALACQPQVLIADEPTTALDVTIQRQILDLLQELQRERNMAMILITHDLGVVAGRTDEVAVMYGGRIVEQAPTSLLFHQPRHPYTVGLLASIPPTDQPPHTRLPAIPGRPTSVIDPVGCRFAPRCPRAQEQCRIEEPQLVVDSIGHATACFFPVSSPTRIAAR